jgi:hypothetical protein
VLAGRSSAHGSPVVRSTVQRVSDEEFAEAVLTAAAKQLDQNRQHYTGLIAGSVRREGLDLVFEFAPTKRPGTTYAYRASDLAEPDEPRNPEGVAAPSSQTGSRSSRPTT